MPDDLSATKVVTGTAAWGALGIALLTALQLGKEFSEHSPPVPTEDAIRYAMDNGTLSEISIGEELQFNSSRTSITTFNAECPETPGDNPTISFSREWERVAPLSWALGKQGQITGTMDIEPKRVEPQSLEACF